MNSRIELGRRFGRDGAAGQAVVLNVGAFRVERMPVVQRVAAAFAEEDAG